MGAMEAWQELTIGIIMMVVLGPAVGNYATSVVFRLPFGQTPFEKKPYCGHCGTMLAPKDLFPILSYLMTRGKCRYCSGTIRSSYTWIEVVCGALFIINYLVFGISEDFILITSIGVFWVILAGLEYHENKLFTLIMTYIAALAGLLRVLHDHTLYEAFFSGFMMLFGALVLWKFSDLVAKRKTTTPPDYVWLALLSGLLLPLPLIPLAAIIWLVVWCCSRGLMGVQTKSISLGVALYVALLAPHVEWLQELGAVV